MTQVGEAFVRVRPLATGFGTELEKETAPALRKFERQVGQSGNQVRKFGRDSRDAEREISRFGRGALVGTGALGGLGRAAAFASTSFIGGAGIVFALKSTISAAMESQAVLAQTEQAVKRSGESWDEYGQKIQDAALQQSSLSGFDDERLLRTFSLLVRRTGDVTKAIQLNALATDVARGRNIELEAAANLVLKATLGQAGALRRLGIDAKVGATQLELVQLLSEKYAGSAVKFADTAAGAQARFGVAIQNTQELIGTALLPELTRLLNRGTDWLNNSKNQELIQRDLNSVIKTSGEFLGVMADALGKVKAAAEPVVETLGGLKNTLELLLALFVAGKVVAFARALESVGAAGTIAGAGLTATAVGATEASVAMAVLGSSTATGSFTNVARTAEVATARTGALRGALLKLGAIGVVTVAIELLINKSAVDKSVTGFLNDKGLGAFTGGNLNFRDSEEAARWAAAHLSSPGLEGELARKILDQLGVNPATNVAALGPIKPETFPTPKEEGGAATSGPAAATSAATSRDAATATALAKAQAEGTQSAIIAAANARLSFIKDTIAFANKLIAQGRGDTKALQSTLQKFYGDEASTQGIIDQIREDNQRIADQKEQDRVDKLAKDAAELKRKAGIRQKAYEATVRTRLVNLRTEVNQTKVGTAARKEAEKNLTDALRAEVHDTNLSAEKRAGYASALTNELNSESAARAKIAAADKARREKDKQDALDRLEIARQTVDQNLANAVARAQLIKDPKAELAAERKADLAIINHIKERIRQLKKGTLEYAQAQGDLYSAQKTFQDLGKTEKTPDAFSLQQFGEYAASQFAQYGSDIGDILSPQDARGEYGKLGAEAARPGIVKTNQTTVFQAFYGDRNTAQAMNDARASARNLKST